MSSNNFEVKGQLVDILKRKIFPARVEIEDSKIKKITEIEFSELNEEGFIFPGFIDSHAHIESSMLVPGEFARLAVVHGTVATVSDPHEIANVCGMKGVEFMIDNGKRVPFKFNFGAPSCVPATAFETAGAALTSEDVRRLLEKEEIRYLSEMMNFPGVLNNDEEVMRKIAAAHALKKPVDGHAPGLRGEEARKYIQAGISTDHESFTAEEALDKLKYGMKILIREGSAAKNFDALIGLLDEHYEQMMFCSDDKHPDSLVEGHINQLCARAVAKGMDVFKVLQAACINPVHHYGLDVGLLKEGDAADFIVSKDLGKFQIKATYVNGEMVAKNGKTLIDSVSIDVINNFNCNEILTEQLIMFTGDYSFFHDKLPVIEALDGQLITNKLLIEPKIIGGNITTDTDKDILKLVVINRYNNAPVAKALIKGFGLKKGAIASSVAHDSHNIIAVGVDDNDLVRAANLVVNAKGGVSCASGGKEMILPLPVAGLMSAKDGYKVAELYTAIDKMAKEAGSKLEAPFMTLSFMALLVIPHLKLSDKGLFDGDLFKFLYNAR